MDLGAGTASPAEPHHREVAMSEIEDFLTPTLAANSTPSRR